MTERYFIMVPPSPSHGVKGGPVQVDLATLDISLLTEIYTRDVRTQSYLRALGVDAIVETGINPSILLERWQGLVDQIEAILLCTSPVGNFAAELRSALADLPMFIKLLAAGQTQEAARALDAFGHALMSASAIAATDLASLEAKVIQHGDLAETMTAIVADGDDNAFYEASASSLALAIDAGLRAYRNLSTYEAELNELCAKVEPQSRVWGGYGDERPLWLSAQLEWLGEEEMGFCTRASRYLISPEQDTSDVMAEAIAEARSRLQTVRDRLAAAQDERDTARTSAERILEQHLGIDLQRKTMRESREAVVKAAQGGVEAFSIVSGLITAEEYAQWQAIMTNPDWRSLHEVGVRLRSKTELVRRLFDSKPSLSEADQRIIHRSQHYIGRLEEALAEFGLELDEAEVAEAQVEGSPSPLVEVEAGLDDNRLQELYELMMAVGAVKYCGPVHLTGGTPKVMLDLLESLGRVTPEERGLYELPLKARLEADSYEVAEGENRLSAWQEVDPSQYHWIKFRQGRGKAARRYTMWRLVERAKDAALSQGFRHGLDPDEIVKAYKARRAERTIR